MISQALQIESRIEGPIGISWLSGFHFTLDDVHIGGPASELFSARQASVRIALMPLFSGKIRPLSISLSEPIIAIVRDADDNFNFVLTPAVLDRVSLLGIEDISFTGATLSYSNTPAQIFLAAQDCALQMRQLRLASGPSTTAMLNFSFAAELACTTFVYNDYSGSNLQVTADAAAGVVSLAPVTMQFLGGQGAGNMQADFSGSVPHYQIHYVLPQLNLQGLLNTLPAAFAAEGALDLTLNLALQGNSAAALTQSANGNIFLHGADLTLTGVDLDEKFEKFGHSQHFDLVDAGAFFLAGPLGLLATKGYDFTSLLVQSGGRTDIPSLISDWIITDGIASAADVAMTTRLNRIALQGQLDLVNAQFVDVTLALLDRYGCSVAHQEVRGSFAQPQIAPSNIITTLAGPVFRILQQGVALLTKEPCEVFYAGKVLAP